MEISLSAEALALVPIVMALTALAKNYMKSKWAPLMALVLGVAGMFLIPQATMAMTILSGIVVGLTASGLYSGGKTMINFK